MHNFSVSTCPATLPPPPCHIATCTINVDLLCLSGWSWFHGGYSGISFHIGWHGCSDGLQQWFSQNMRVKEHVLKEVCFKIWQISLHIFSFNQKYDSLTVNTVLWHVSSGRTLFAKKADVCKWRICIMYNAITEVWLRYTFFCTYYKERVLFSIDVCFDSLLGVVLYLTIWLRFFDNSVPSFTIKSVHRYGRFTMQCASTSLLHTGHFWRLLSTRREHGEDRLSAFWYITWETSIDEAFLTP